MVKQPQEKNSLAYNSLSRLSRANQHFTKYSSPLDQDHEWNLALKLGKSIVEIKHMLKAKSITSGFDRSEASPFFKSASISPITELKRNQTPT